MDSGIDPYRSDELLVVLEDLYVSPQFNEKVERRLISDTLHGREDLRVLFHLLIRKTYDDFHDLFVLLLDMEKQSSFLLEDQIL